MRRARIARLGTLLALAVAGVLCLYRMIESVPQNQGILESYARCLVVARVRLGHAPARLADAGSCPEAEEHGAHGGSDGLGRSLVYDTRGDDWVLIAVGWHLRGDLVDAWRRFDTQQKVEATKPWEDQIASSRGLLRASFW